MLARHVGGPGISPPSKGRGSLMFDHCLNHRLGAEDIATSNLSKTRFLLEELRWPHQETVNIFQGSAECQAGGEKNKKNSMTGGWDLR